MLQRKTESSEKSEPSAEPLARAIEALEHGEVIVFPTETFYGLGADARDETAVERVVSLKGRAPESPIPVIVADEKMLQGIVAEVPEMARKLMSRFWPGPLTLVLPARKRLPLALLSREGEIGVRISSHPLATQLTGKLGCPLTATSANPSGGEPARTIEEAKAYFAGRLEIFLAGGRLAGKKGSTVVAFGSGGLRIIREGEISLEDLKKALALSP